MLESYAIVTARNVVASLWRERDRHRRNQHRVVDLLPDETHDDGLVAQEEQSAVAQALARLSQRERDTLLAHEVAGQDTRSLAGELGSTAGAVAAQLNRTRARLRVEYLLARRPGRAADRAVPPGPARPVERRPPPAAGGRRRDATCSSATSARGSASRFMERGQPRDDEVRIPIHVRRRHRRGATGRARAGRPPRVLAGRT